MAKIEHSESKKKYELEYPTYSNETLRELEKEINEKYNRFKTVKDHEQWLIDNGGLTPELAVIYTEAKPIKYQILQDKLEKLQRLQRKTSWAKKQEMIRLADTYKVDINEIDYQDVQ